MDDFFAILIVCAPAALIVGILNDRSHRFHLATYALGRVLCSEAPILLGLTIIFFYVSFSWPIVLITILAMFVDRIPFPEARLIVLLAIFSAGALLVLFSLASYYKSYFCRFDGQGVTVQTLWSGKKHHIWDQLSRVLYDRKYRRFEFYFNGRSHFRVSENQLGSQDLVAAVKELGHPIEQYGES